MAAWSRQDGATARVYWHPCDASSSPLSRQISGLPSLAPKPFAGRSLAGLRLNDAMKMIRIGLYQPDIAQNTGTILRLCACFGIEAHIIEPAGFPVSDRAFRRAGLDYLDQVAIVRHVDWRAFEAWRRGAGARLLLFTTSGAESHLDFGYRDGDVLMFGRESAGVPAGVHEAADARLVIPMREGLRSLNVAVSAAMAAGEALRQTGGFHR